MFIKKTATRKQGMYAFLLPDISIIFFLLLSSAGCNQGPKTQANSIKPLGAYLINYSAASHKLGMQSVDVTPPSAGENVTGKAGLFQSGNAVFDGVAITAPVFVTNNDKDDWTGVVIQAYGLKSGNATVCDADLGTNWYVDNPDDGAWGWIFTSGTSGSEFTIPSGGRSAANPIGFNASSDFASVVYIYAGAPIITDVVPDNVPSGAMVTITGYNFSTTEGAVTFNGITGTVQSWGDRDIEVTVPPNGATGDVIVHTVDPSVPCSNPFKRPRQAVSIDCSTPGPNPVNAGSTMGCTIYARGGVPQIDSSADTCGGSIIDGGYCGDGWTYAFSPAAGQSGTCTAAVINGSAQAQAAITINAASPWPKFRANARNTGLSTVDTSSVTGLLKWSNTDVAISYADSPVVGADGTIYIGGSNLYAVNPDGTLKWMNNTPWGKQYTTPYIAPDGTIYVGTFIGNLEAINPDGTNKWSYTAGGNILYSSPVMDTHGTIYIGSMDDKLYAINPDGTLKWTYATGGWIWSTPAIGSDGTIYVGSQDDNLYAINPDGTLKWIFNTGTPMYFVSPAIGADGTVYIGTSNNTYNLSYLYAINPDGTLKWKYTMNSGGSNSSPSIGTDGTIYLGAGNLYALNQDGTLKWSYGANIVGSSPAIGADGTIYVGSNCYVLAINPDATLKWSYYDGNTVSCGGIGSSPAIGPDGTVYIGEGGGPLFAFH